MIVRPGVKGLCLRLPAFDVFGETSLGFGQRGNLASRIKKMKKALQPSRSISAKCGFRRFGRRACLVREPEVGAKVQEFVILFSSGPGELQTETEVPPCVCGHDCQV